MSKHIKISGLLLMLIFNLKLAKAENANTNKEESAVFTLVNQLEELNTPTGGGESLGSSECTEEASKQMDDLISTTEKELDHEVQEFTRDLDLMKNSNHDVNQSVISNSYSFEDLYDDLSDNLTPSNMEILPEVLSYFDSYTWKIKENWQYDWTYNQTINVNLYRKLGTSNCRKEVLDGGCGIKYSGHVYKITSKRDVFTIASPNMPFNLTNILELPKTLVTTSAKITIDPQASITGNLDIKFNMAKVIKDIFDVCIGTNVKVEKKLAPMLDVASGTKEF